MEKQDYKPELSLKSLGLFSDETIEKLKGYNIFTIGQLLGATKGLTQNIEALFNSPCEQETLQKVLERIPDEVLKKEREFHFRPHMGLIVKPKEQGDESEKNDI